MEGSTKRGEQDSGDYDSFEDADQEASAEIEVPDAETSRSSDKENAPLVVIIECGKSKLPASGTAPRIDPFAVVTHGLVMQNSRPL